MPHSDLDNALEQLTVRTVGDGDHKVVTRLYTDGLLAGQLASNDTGADIDNLREAYFADESNHFWVAEIDGEIVGMIGVARDDEHTAEIRRLRVDKRWQQTDLAGRLIETALAHCTRHSYLKVRFDTRFERNAALELFERFGFQHTRSKTLEDKETLEFYLDLYRQRDEE